MFCVNTNLSEYQTIKKQSGISDFQLKGECAYYLEKYGRFPYLNELYKADSSQYLKDTLKIKKDGCTKLSTLQEQLGTSDPIAMQIQLNDQYRDKEISVLPLGESAEVTIIPRPTTTSERTAPHEISEQINNHVWLEETCSRLADLYGIKINHVTTQSLLDSQILEEVPDAVTAKGFIHNGEIYVNSDYSTVDTELHEMMHLLVGSIKFQSPEVYQKLLDSVISLINIPTYLHKYPHRTQNDVLEEILVTEISKLLTNQSTEFSKLGDQLTYEIYYNITRTLDSMLFGDVSVQIVPPEELSSNTIRQLARAVNSAMLTQINQHSLTYARQHRIGANIKSELLKQNKLKEICI